MIRNFAVYFTYAAIVLVLLGGVYYSQSRPAAHLVHASEPVSAIITGYSSTSTTPSRRSYYLNGFRRAEESGSLRQIYKDGRLYTFRKPGADPTVKISPELSIDEKPEFTLSDAVDALERSGQKFTLTSGTYGKKAVDELIDGENNNSDYRSVSFYDRTSHWQIAGYEEERRSGVWVTYLSEFYDYATPVPPSKFDFSLPDSTPLVRDYDSVPDMFKSPGTSFYADHKKISVRVADMNEGGEVFVLYTDGPGLGGVIDKAAGRKPGSSSSAEYVFSSKPGILVSDSLGTKYAPVKWVAAFEIGSSASALMEAGGQVVHGVWLKPLQPGKWAPRTLRISVEGATVSLFTQRFQHPSARLYPNWMTLIGVKP